MGTIIETTTICATDSNGQVLAVLQREGDGWGINVPRRDETTELLWDGMRKVRVGRGLAGASAPKTANGNYALPEGTTEADAIKALGEVAAAVDRHAQVVHEASLIGSRSILTAIALAGSPQLPLEG